MKEITRAEHYRDCADQILVGEADHTDLSQSTRTTARATVTVTHALELRVSSSCETHPQNSAKGKGGSSHSPLRMNKGKRNMGCGGNETRASAYRVSQAMTQCKGLTG